MPPTGLNVINETLPSQNVLLFLALLLAAAGTVALVAAWLVALEKAHRALRWLRYRRLVLAWRLLWLVAVPILEPLALLWATVVPLAARTLPARSALVAGPRWRRDAFRPLAGQVARWV